MTEKIKTPDEELRKLIGKEDFSVIQHLSEKDKNSILQASPYIEIANHLHQGFCLGDKDHKTIYVNSAYRKLCKYSLQECLGKPNDFCFTEESKKKIEKHHGLREKGKSSQYEADIVSKDGNITQVLINGTTHKEGGTMGIFTNLVLMDKLSRTEQELLSIIGYKDLQTIKKTLPHKCQEMLVKYKHAIQLVNTLGNCFWMGDKSHQTLYVNKAYQDLTGYALEECIGKPADFCFTEESKKRIAEHHKLRSANVSSQYEAEYATKDGKTIPVLVIGAPTEAKGSYGMHIDMTKMRDLQTQEKMAQQVLKHSREAIVIMDKDRRITLWNAGATRMFGYKEEEVKNKKIDFLIPYTQIRTNRDLIKEVEKKGHIRNIEAKRLAKNGTEIDVLVSVTKVTEENKNFVGFLIIYQDITHIKKTTSELQKRFEAIQDAYKELGLQKRYLDYMYEIIDTTVSSCSKENLEKVIISAMALLTKCDGAILRLYDKQKNTLKLKSHFGVGPKWWNKNQIHFENSIAQESFENKRALIIDDIDTFNKHQGQNLVKIHQFKTLIMIPLFIEKNFIGSISLYSTDPAKFRFIETDFLEKMGKQCSMAIFIKNQI